MRNCCMDAWSIRNEALAAYTARKQKRPNIFERFAHREFLKAGWSIEQMLAETIQDVYAEALLEDELQDFPDDTGASPLPPDSLRSWGTGFLREPHKERDGRYTYGGYLERLDVASQLRKRQVLDELIEALGKASKMLQVSNPVKPDLESLLEDLCLYRSLTEYHSIKRLIQNEAAVFSQVLEVIAEAFGAPCSWEGVTELMESRPGGWCGQNCGNMAYSACWGKFLEQKMMQKQQAVKN